MVYVQHSDVVLQGSKCFSLKRIPRPFHGTAQGDKESLQQLSEKVSRNEKRILAVRPAFLATRGEGRKNCNANSGCNGQLEHCPDNLR